jgi:hypothetical protein
MKKIKKILIAGAAVVLIVASLTACDSTTHKAEEKKEEVNRFQRVYKQGLGGLGDIFIYVDTETGVMYTIADVGYGAGLTVMVDENGKPLIWEGYEK